MKIFKFSVVFLCILFAVGFVVTAVMIIKQNMIDLTINDNITSLTHNVKYKNPVNIKSVPVVRQKISGGYACIEMLSKYLGNGAPPITEDILYKENGNKISASTNKGLYNEIQKQFPDYKITQYRNLKNSELINKIYESLAKDMPVIFSYAAAENSNRSNGEGETETEADNKDAVSVSLWTMNYGIIVGMDIPGDRITVNNTYGYSETYSIKEFLKTTRFENYENMEFFLKLRFAVEIFTKNTIYVFDQFDNFDNFDLPEEN